MTSNINLNKILLYSTILVLFIPGDNKKLVLLGGILIIHSAVNGFVLKTKKSLLSFSMLYFITVFLSNIFKMYENSIHEILYFIAVFFIPGYIISKCVITKKFFFEIIDFILLIFSIYAILCIIEGFSQFNIFDIILERQIELWGANSYRMGIYRSHGYCSVSINNGMILFMVWMLASYRLYNVTKVKYLIPFILIGISLFLNLSRMVIIVAVAAQLLILIQLKKSKLFSYICCTILVLIGIMLLFPEKVESIFSDIYNTFIPLIEEFFGNTERNNGMFSGGSGHRFALWNWVYNSTKDSLLLGQGYGSVFNYIYYVNGFYVIKESIEVHWLYLLYHAGVLGLSGFICYQFYCIKEMLSTRVISKNSLEKPTFVNVFIIMSLGYFAILFTCAGFEDLELYYILFPLFLAYKKLSINGDEVEKE